jgi:hypothetical protein
MALSRNGEKATDMTKADSRFHDERLWIDGTEVNLRAQRAAIEWRRKAASSPRRRAAHTGAPEENEHHV